MTRLYRVGEVATLTGVSIRTLHHYDRIGLLRPSAHSEGRHRLYSEGDLLRLHQILTLRYLGFSLKQIGGLLLRTGYDLAAALRTQRRVLRGQIVELERIDATLGRLLEQRVKTGYWDWQLVIKASVAVQTSLRQKGETMDRTQRLFEELGRQITPDERQAIERQWQDVLAEVRAKRDLDPAGPEAQALADRWTTLIQATFRGNQELAAGVAEKYRRGDFVHYQAQGLAPSSEDFAFIERVNRARQSAL